MQTAVEPHGFENHDQTTSHGSLLPFESELKKKKKKKLKKKKKHTHTHTHYLQVFFIFSSLLLFLHFCLLCLPLFSCYFLFLPSHLLNLIVKAKFGIQTVFRKKNCEQYARQTIQLVGLILKLEFRPKIQTIVAFSINAAIGTKKNATIVLLSSPKSSLVNSNSKISLTN